MAFERKYGVLSEIYAAYASGEEPEQEDWVLIYRVGKRL